MKKFQILFAIFCTIFTQSCSPSLGTETNPSNNAIQTYAAQTLALFPSASRNLLDVIGTPTAETFPKTQIALPSAINTPTKSIPPSLTPFSITDSPEWLSQTSTYSVPTSVSSATKENDYGIEKPCHLVEFIQDVTIPDGMSIPTGLPFTKVWRLKNAGSCSWPTSYKVIFFSGERMAGVSTPLGRPVLPGEIFDLAINLTAPAMTGNFKGNWMLEGTEGVFGSGTNGSTPFYVQIKTIPNSNNILYNFALNFCAARWESNAGRLYCPGLLGDPQGFVIMTHNPLLETRQENEPALHTHPSLLEDGWITGSFPAQNIEHGDHFLAEIGCLSPYVQCNVNFQISYRILNTPQKQLGVWQEFNDQHLTRLDIDLSFLAGKSVIFILGVKANESPDQAGAFWLMPQIRRP
jgi:hypothetical protein